MKPDHSQGLLVRMGDKLHRIRISDVAYVQADDENLQLHCTNGKVHCVRCTLKKFMSLYQAPQFVQTHRSFLVQLSYVTDVGMDDVYLNGTPITLSRHFRKEFMQWFELG